MFWPVTRHSKGCLVSFCLTVKLGNDYGSMSEEKIVERIEANEEAAKEHKKLFDSKLDRLLERIEQLQEDLWRYSPV